jgi:hypothetical protein
MIDLNQLTRSRTCTKRSRWRSLCLSRSSVCFAESMIIIGSIAMSIFIPNLASAKDFKIGSVKQQFDFGGMCVSLLPQTQKYMLVVPFPLRKSQPVIAWINIDGKDLQMRQVSLKVMKSNRRSVAKYQSRNISVTVDYRNIKEDNSGMSTQTSTDRISIEYAGQTKIINTTGSCSV